MNKGDRVRILVGANSEATGRIHRKVAGTEWWVVLLEQGPPWRGHYSPSEMEVIEEQEGGGEE